MFVAEANEHSLLPRVIDGTTGKPLAGATIELWTEDQGAEGELVHGAVTANDGFALLLPRYEQAEKIRVTCPGYASTAGASSHLNDGPIELLPAQPMRGRIVDLEGRPVAGALVRTRQGCPHAVSAAQARTDEAGHFVLADCPPQGDRSPPDIEVLAPGHAALPQTAAGPLRRRQAITGQCDIFTPRRRPVAFRMLAPPGDPAVGARVIANDSPVQSTRVAADGSCTFLPFSDDREEHLSLRVGNEWRQLRPCVFPSEATLAVSVIGAEQSGERATLDVTLEVPADLADEVIPVQVTDSSGASKWGSNLGGNTCAFDVARGEVVVLVGQRFSGIEEQTHTLSVTDDDTSLRVRVEAEAELSVRVPEEGLRLVHLQAGDDSVSRTGMWHDAGPLTYYVPRGERVVILAVDGAEAIRRAIFEPPDLDEGVTNVRLDTDKSMVRAPLDFDDLPTSTLRLEIRDDRGQPVEDAIAYFRSSGIHEESTEWTGADPEWSVPAGVPVTLRVRADGHRSVLAPITTTLADATTTSVVVLPRLATVVLSGNVARVLGSSVQRNDKGTVASLVPGKTRVLVLRREGAPVLLQLELAPGSQRHLAIE